MTDEPGNTSAWSHQAQQGKPWPLQWAAAAASRTPPKAGCHASQSHSDTWQDLVPAAASTCRGPAIALPLSLWNYLTIAPDSAPLKASDLPTTNN